MKNTTTPDILYGGDYNPEQWLQYPEILNQDIEYFKQAHINVVTLGVFSWSTIEPSEGNYNLQWLEDIINNLYENNIYTILATPSGARPKWLADKYPEVLRTDSNRTKRLFGGRHNHCFSSPIYREKVHDIDYVLAEKFEKHPAILYWHISNEFSGDCHCPLCQHSFQQWLENKYGNIQNLNDAWCTSFWSHTYQDFSQVESPSPIGETELHGLNLDWKRFVTDQTLDFAQSEINAIREAGAMQPVTTNFMYDFDGLDYAKFSEIFDIISWDNYPMWHKLPEPVTAMDTGMQHDLMRSLKNKPYLMMESSPSTMSWPGVSKTKRPGMLKASSLQAIAHGSDSVLFFQLRQSQGGCEKFHGAVIDHYGGNDTRIFKEVCELGETLEQIPDITGSWVISPAAIFYDWNNRWALEDSKGPRNQDLHYKETVFKSYTAIKKYGINIDLISAEHDLSNYKLLVAPMQYLCDINFTNKLRRFVYNGGTLIMTYWSGIVDENDKCYLGGTPANLMDVLGLRSTEIDSLYDGETNLVAPVAHNPLGLNKSYECMNLCDVVTTTTAEILMNYQEDFYKDTPAFTRNKFGKGYAYYICADMEQSFYNDIYPHILKEAQIEPLLNDLPDGVEITSRENETSIFIFMTNFNQSAVKITSLPKGYSIYYGPNTGILDKYETMILRFEKRD